VLFRRKAEMPAFWQSPLAPENTKSGQDGLAVPLITGRARVAAWRRPGRIFNAPKGNQDGWASS
jgi:hypothetical protein